MPLVPRTLEDLYDHGFDAVIDVRSPAEYDIDHIPGAINMPALSNDERAEVGTLYKQVSPFKARKLGAALVLQNISRHLEGPLRAHDGSWQPLIYCWRGGQRSGVFGTLLREIGWRAETIAGGYQTYRKLVHAQVYGAALPHRIILLDGFTGTAKTQVLPYLKAQGVQTLDLEGLAGHRGSLLGAMPGGQPDQKRFESRLAREIHAFDPDRPVIVEAESNKIGRINLPPALWEKMQSAPRILLSAPMPARVAHICNAYQSVLADPETVKTRLAPLRQLRGHSTVDRWQALQDSGDLAGLAQALMEDHYDPAYEKSRARVPRKTLAEIPTQALDPASLESVADAVFKAISKT